MALSAVPAHTHHRPPWLGPVLRRLGGHGGVVLGVLVAAVKIAAAPHKASLARLWDIPLTVMGAGCMDFAAFHLAHGWGWLVTGVSLVLVEHLIADER